MLEPQRHAAIKQMFPKLSDEEIQDYLAAEARAFAGYGLLYATVMGVPVGMLTSNFSVDRLTEIWLRTLVAHEPLPEVGGATGLFHAVLALARPLVEEGRDPADIVKVLRFAALGARDTRQANPYTGALLRGLITPL